MVQYINTRGMLKHDYTNVIDLNNKGWSVFVLWDSVMAAFEPQTNCIKNSAVSLELKSCVCELKRLRLDEQDAWTLKTSKAPKTPNQTCIK